jgi:hypothetical protein
MLEQEIASVMRFVLKHSNNPFPYYESVPEGFCVPSVYFPQPEIMTGGGTLKAYGLSYSWFIKFYHKDTQSAHALGVAVLTALKSRRNAVPLIERDGALTGRMFRLKDPALRTIDDMAVQLTLMWDSYRPYHDETSQKTMKFDVDLFLKNAFNRAVNQV